MPCFCHTRTNKKSRRDIVVSPQEPIVEKAAADMDKPKKPPEQRNVLLHKNLQ